MALANERQNDIVSTSDEQSGSRSELQSSRKYLLSMLQDPQESSIPVQHCSNIVTDFHSIQPQVIGYQQSGGSYFLISATQASSLLKMHLEAPKNQSVSIDVTRTAPTLVMLGKSSSATSPSVNNDETPQTNSNILKKNDAGTDSSKKFDVTSKGSVLTKMTPDPKKTLKMGPKCNCKLSVKSKKYHCNEFTDSERQPMFDHYWNAIQKPQRKVLVASLVKCLYPRSRRKSCADPTRKEVTFRYHLKKGGRLLRVCRVMFLNTFNIREYVVKDCALARVDD